FNCNRCVPRLRRRGVLITLSGSIRIRLRAGLFEGVSSKPKVKLMSPFLTVTCGQRGPIVRPSVASARRLPCFRETENRYKSRGLSMPLVGLVRVVLLSGGVTTWAQDRPKSATPSTASLSELTPLSRETWPIWRDAYIRTYFDDTEDVERERRFYDQVRGFITASTAGSDGSLPKELANDPIAWIALSSAYLHRNDDAGPRFATEHELSAAEDAGRKAVALGDPQGIASYNLAAVLIYRGLVRDRAK